jgi:integrase
MGLYRRPDSPYWWMTLERVGRRPLQQSTRVPADGGTEAQTRLNRQLAQSIYAAAMGDVARGRFGLEGPGKPRITFAAFRGWYEREVIPTLRHQARNLSMLRQLGRYFDARELHTLTKEDGFVWRKQRSTEVSAGTVNREMARMKSLLSLAVPTYLDANPWAGLSEMDSDEGEPAILSEDDERKLLKAADPVETALVVCALDTLMRLSTVAALARKQDHGAYLTVLRPKGKGKRIPYKVPVSRRLREAFDALPKDGPHYFTRYQGGSGEAVRKRVELAFAALCAHADVACGRAVGGITFHSLRHTGASRMLNRGVDLRTVAEIGNWRDLAVLQRYLHPLGDARERAVELVGGLRPVDGRGKTARFQAKKQAR